MRATEFVTEMFDAGYPISKGLQFASSGEVHAEAYDADGRIIDISFPSTGYGRGIEIVFKRGGSYDLTGQGDASRVLATVVNAISMYLQKYQPPYIAFSAKSTGGRVGAYTAMIKRHARGYTLLDPEEYPEEVMKFLDYLGSDKPFVLVRNEFLRENTVDEMALKQFTPMGDFDKPGPFRGVDRRLVPHPKNQLKTAKFFERTPYDFRLFFSNIPGTGKYRETGPVNAQQLQQMFGEQAQPIIEGSEDAITVVFVGNSGDSKVMMTPWIMAHRFGHAIKAGVRRNSGWSTWAEAEKHFFTAVNTMLGEYYVKSAQMKADLTPEYNALFNAIGTQRSSRDGEINRPNEFVYEILAQYLGTGNVTFNPLPGNLGYGRKNWGNSSKYMYIKPEYRDEGERADATQTLANDMQYMFDDVLSSSVGQIFVM